MDLSPDLYYTHITQWSVKVSNCYQTRAKVHKAAGKKAPILERNTKPRFMEIHYKINSHFTIIKSIFGPFWKRRLILSELQRLQSCSVSIFKREKEGHGLNACWAHKQRLSLSPGILKSIYLKHFYQSLREAIPYTVHKWNKFDNRHKSTLPKGEYNGSWCWLVVISAQYSSWV